MKYTSLLFLLVLFSCTPKLNQTPALIDAKPAITKVLLTQQAAWNRGDIEAFMEGYLKTEDLSFVGSKGVTKGWEATLNNYKKGYPDKAAMGELIFDIISIDQLSNNAAFMIGKYTLKREQDEPSGYFTLLWKKVNGEWVIAVDQTSG